MATNKIVQQEDKAWNCVDRSKYNSEKLGAVIEMLLSYCHEHLHSSPKTTIIHAVSEVMDLHASVHGSLLKAYEALGGDDEQSKFN